HRACAGARSGGARRIADKSCAAATGPPPAARPCDDLAALGVGAARARRGSDPAEIYRYGGREGLTLYPARTSGEGLAEGASARARVRPLARGFARRPPAADMRS